MDTIHEHCSLGLKKKYKNFKNFLVYDLIYSVYVTLHMNALTWHVKIFTFSVCE